jgi:two-component system response regulator (stage 0 sporulation protein A)
LQIFLFSVIFKGQGGEIPVPTKILIADDSEEFRQALASSLDSSYQIRTCSDGLQAQELLQSFRPDILVTELMLARLDGLSLLQGICNTEERPKILVLSRHFSPYVISALARLGVDYSMQKPCSIQALVWRIGDFVLEDTEEAPTPPPAEDWVTASLLRLGVGAHLDGFRYLQLAIPRFSLDTHQSITKELYSFVGEVCGKTDKQVERSIRSAIEKAWDRRNNRIWMEYFVPAPDGQVPKQSNGRFIANLVQKMKEMAQSPYSA